MTASREEEDEELEELEEEAAEWAPLAWPGVWNLRMNGRPLFFFESSGAGSASKLDPLDFDPTPTEVRRRKEEEEAFLLLLPGSPLPRRGIFVKKRREKRNETEKGRRKARLSTVDIVFS